MSLPSGLATQEPMLAAPCRDVASSTEEALTWMARDGHWIYEVKYDGVRCLAYVLGGEVKLRNRRGADITFRYPEVVKALAAEVNDDVVLDGELICYGENGLPDFSRIHWRDAQGRASVSTALAESTPARYVAFDVLYLNGDDLRKQNLAVRQAALSLVKCSVVEEPLRSGVGPALWEQVIALGLEGIVAKDLRSLYSPGRHRSWVKMKATKCATVFVLGYVPGEGSREGSIGALSMGVWADRPGGDVRYVGNVGSGFTRRDLDVLLPRMGQVLLIEVEYLGLTKGGQLRHPVFKGIRDDVTPLAATASQLH